MEAYLPQKSWVECWERAHGGCQKLYLGARAFILCRRTLQSDPSVDT